MPVLGQDDTDMDDVYAFYDYWEKFESWRDFSLSAREHDPDQADSREEKRWMQKENERGVKTLKKKEYKRISTLVETARSVMAMFRFLHNSISKSLESKR